MAWTNNVIANATCRVYSEQIALEWWGYFVKNFGCGKNESNLPICSESLTTHRYRQTIRANARSEAHIRWAFVWRTQWRIGEKQIVHERRKERVLCNVVRSQTYWRPACLLKRMQSSLIQLWFILSATWLRVWNKITGFNLFLPDDRKMPIKKRKSWDGAQSTKNFAGQ